MALGAAPAAEQAVQQIGSLRERISKMPVTLATDIDALLRSDYEQTHQTFDCCIPHPCQVGCSGRARIRLEARVEGVIMDGEQRPGPLFSPFTRRECVLYTAAVTRPLHQSTSVPPVPVSFANAALDFTVVLLTNETTRSGQWSGSGGTGDPGDELPPIRVKVRGDDVCLFDVRGGRFSAREVFASTPEHWQDFMLTNRGGAALGSAPRSSLMFNSMGCLEFSECALAVGTVVTIAGELLRDSDGTLSLVPGQDDTFLAGGSFPENDRGSDGSTFSRVSVSDDPLLLGGDTKSGGSKRSWSPIKKMKLFGYTR